MIGNFDDRRDRHRGRGASGLTGVSRWPQAHIVEGGGLVRRIVLAAVILTCPATRAGAQATIDPRNAPAAMQGVWGREGRCDVPADRLTITPKTAGWGDGPFKAIDYSDEDKSIHWNEEYEVDNFVSGRDDDIMVHNTMGFDMPGQEGYARCGPDLARKPWPPKPAGER